MRKISKNDQWFAYNIAESYHGHTNEQNKNIWPKGASLPRPVYIFHAVEWSRLIYFTQEIHVKSIKRDSFTKDTGVIIET